MSQFLDQMMNQKDLLFGGAILFFFGWRWLRQKQVLKLVPDMIRRGAVIVDVRSVEEYKMGHVEGSLNIPLSELPNSMGKLDKTKPILICCASGARSGVGATMLRSKGFSEVVNAGGWVNLLDIAGKKT
ncbi:MAG: hypothetical protein BroJett040_23730 [Oligoflexia bacterium]|nr:MAG: hypothetical protein BroJett040_23730 [Oligoflexia bacterium]